MDSYEGIMSNPMGGGYPMSHQNNYPQFTDGAGMPGGYGHLGNMPAAFGDTSRSSANNSMMNFRSGYPMPHGQSHDRLPGFPDSNLPPTSSAASFPMHYDTSNIRHQTQPQDVQPFPHSSMADRSTPPYSQAMHMSTSAQSSMSVHNPPSPPLPHQTQLSSSSYIVSNKPVHSCSYCGLVLSSANALIEHKRIHTGDRPFGCHICGKKFTQKAHLNIHKRTHTGEKPYACHICNKRFAQSSHLSSHVRTHTGEKPFRCGLCNIGFTQKQRLDAHLKKHLELEGPEALSRIMGSGGGMEVTHHISNRGRRPAVPDNQKYVPMISQDTAYIKQEVNEEDMMEPSVTFADANNLTPALESDKDVMRAHHNNNHGSNSVYKDEMSSERAENEDDRMLTGLVSSGLEPNPSQSFSSEGMFLHPSGYVAYGGSEDKELPNEQQSLQGAARRKPSVVRKLPIESSDGEMVGKEEQAEPSTGELETVSPLQREDNNHNCDSVAQVETDTEEFQDAGERVDTKHDPTYHGNPATGTAVAPAMTTCRGSHPQQEVHNQYTSNRESNPYPPANNSCTTSSNHHHQHKIPTSKFDHSFINGGTARFNNPTSSQQESFTYSAPKAPLTESPSAGGQLIKVNNRISLVNFTAEELLAHLMKRDDINKCQFCCLVFQDAAMYHIHRNMHDRSDPRVCNMCGKMLADKYDFTAHFLSMHKM